MVINKRLFLEKSRLSTFNNAFALILRRSCHDQSVIDQSTVKRPTLIKECKDFDFATIKYGKYKSCVLTNRKHVIQAQSMLHNYYVNESKWQWSTDAPTGFRVLINDDSTPYIVDNYENNSFWIGSFIYDELISIMRIVYRTEKEKLDIECYDASKENSKIKAVLSEPNIIEIQRFVTKLDYRKQQFNLLCLLSLGNILTRYNLNIIASSPTLAFLKFGIGQLLDDKFNYGDDNFVNVLYFTQKDITNIVDFLSTTLK